MVISAVTFYTFYERLSVNAKGHLNSPEARKRETIKNSLSPFARRIKLAALISVENHSVHRHHWTAANQVKPPYSHKIQKTNNHASSRLRNILDWLLV
jgi:plasmid stability protein